MSVTSLCYGEDGAIWIGTEGGLVTYDGRACQPVRSSRGAGELGITRCTALVSGDRGIWAGGGLGTLMLFADEETVLGRIQTPLQVIKSLIRDREGCVWAGGSGVIRLVEGAAEIVLDPADYPRLRVFSLLEEPALEGSSVTPPVIWIMTNRGVFRWSESEGLEQVETERANGLFFGSDGTRWRYGPGLEVRRNGVLVGPANLEVGLLREAIELGGGRWLLVLGSGLVTAEVTGDSLRFERVAGPAKVRATLPAPSAGLWIATELSGAQFLEPTGYSILTKQLAPMVSTLGSFNGGAAYLTNPWLPKWLEILPGESNSDGLRVIEHPAPLSGKTQGATQIIRDPRGRHYFGSARGAFVEADPQEGGGGTSLKKVLGGPTAGFVCGPDDKVWISNRSRVREFKDGVATGREVRTQGKPLSQLQLRGKALIGIAGPRLVSLDTETATETELLGDQGVALRNFWVDDDETFWVTTYGAGLLRLRIDGTIDRWSSSDGFPDANLAWVGRVPGTSEATHLWVGSNRGTFAVSVEGLDRQVAGEQEIIDYLWIQTPEANGPGGAALSNGALLLPTLQGEVLIETDSVLSSRVPPQLSLSGIRSGGQPLDLGSGTLTGAQDLEFWFRAVQFPTTQRSYIEFKLDGHDDRWLPAHSERKIRYTNLGPGEYRFHLRARTAGGEFGPVVQGEVFRIQAAWWLRPAALYGLLAVLVTLAATGVRLRTRALLKRSQGLQAEIEKRKLSERDLVSSRMEFFSVLEAAEEGIFSFDEDGSVRFANAAMSRIFGMPTDRFRGASTVDLGISELTSREAIRSLHSEALESERMNSLSTRATRADGTTFPCELTVSLRSNAEPFRLVVILRDVSERELAAQQLEGLRRQLAKAEESQRSHIARELHDDYSQRLMATALHLGALQRRLKGADEAQAIGRVQGDIEKLGEDLHDLSRRLHPAVLDDLGLSAALRSECGRRSALGSASIEFSESLEVEQPVGEVALALFRVAQEALNNALRHSGASQVRIVLESDERRTRLLVEDNGTGFDAEVAHGPGIGLSSMRERARLVGGRFSVRSVVGRGTEVEALVPRATSVDMLTPAKSKEGAALKS